MDTTIYHELKVMDAFGDVWTTGLTGTLEELKEFVTNPAKLEQRRAARRHAEDLAKTKFTRSNPCAWRIDRVTMR